MLRVVSWPMGFIIVASGRQGLFFWSELAYTVVHLGAAWTLVKSLGVNGAGIAFSASYVFHGLMIYMIVRRLTGFRWSPANRRVGGIFLGSTALVFCGFYVLAPWLAFSAGVLATLGGGAFSLRLLSRLVPVEGALVPRFVRRLPLFPRRGDRTHER